MGIVSENGATRPLEKGNDVGVVGEDNSVEAIVRGIYIRECPEGVQLLSRDVVIGVLGCEQDYSRSRGYR